MAYADLLVHQVSVRRRSGRTDRFGQAVDRNPTKTSQADEVATYACRAYYKSGGLASRERTVDVFEELQMVHAPADADIREDDVLVITDAATGDPVLPPSIVKYKDIVYSASQPHHLEVTVECQRGPA